MLAWLRGLLPFARSEKPTVTVRSVASIFGVEPHPFEVTDPRNLLYPRPVCGVFVAGDKVCGRTARSLVHFS